MTTFLYLMACLMSPAPLINLAESRVYVFYPYFQGRRKTWYFKAMVRNDDPLFQNFLNAGEARLVISVRPSFEGGLRY